VRCSFLTRFEAISRGVLDARDVLFFASIIGVFVAATGVVVNMKKAV
jgi:ABC-2 type transport system permease protein